MSVWKDFGIRAVHLRYKSNPLKGLYWYLFSIKVRKRDFEKYGTCISCGTPVFSWREFDAGHYIAAGQCGFALLFDERNVNGECGGCNGFDGTHLIGYAKRLDERYGEGTAQKLYDRYCDVQFKAKITKEWSAGEYRAAISQLLSTPEIEMEVKRSKKYAKMTSSNPHEKETTVPG